MCELTDIVETICLTVVAVALIVSTLIVSLRGL